MSHYHIYGIGAALVDTEIEVSDEDLINNNIDKGVMTLVDEARQHELMNTLSDHLVASKRASGGSAANTITPNELYAPAIEKAEYVYIEGYLVTSDTGRTAAIQLRQQAEAKGIKTALSLSDPAMVEFFRDGLSDMIGDKVDLLFCNLDEALSYTQTDNIDDAANSLKTIAREFAITLGNKGALLYDGKKAINIEATPTKAIDTNGAGDMFAGAYLYGITHGYSRELAGKLASTAAAQVVSQYGPRLKPEQHQAMIKSVLT